MYKIYINCNLGIGDLSIDTSKIGFYFSDLIISFTNNSNQDILRFNNLNFLYRFSLNDQIISEKTYPPLGIKYLSTSDDYLVAERLTFLPTNEYKLYFWCENNGQSFEKTVTFTIPTPSKPFESWIWDSVNKIWISPIERPNDLHSYEWIEETISWKKKSPIMSRLDFIYNLNNLKLTEDTSALDKAESMINSNSFSENSKIFWKNTAFFNRKDPFFVQWVSEMQLTETQLNVLFNV
jgi:hypothetical protein